MLQNRFLSRQTENTASSDDIVYQWWIPLSYTSAAHEMGQKTAEWMSDKQQALTLELLMAEKYDWVIFNVDQQSEFTIHNMLEVLTKDCFFPFRLLPSCL